MILNEVRDKLAVYLPGYINGNLSRLLRFCISKWIGLDPEGQRRFATARHLKENANSLPYRQPSSKVLKRIRKQVKNQSRSESKQSSMWPVWAIQITLALLAFILVWRGLPPGIVLEWSIRDGEPSKFLVYRAELGSLNTLEDSNFVLLKEIPVSEQETLYEFMDMRLLPGQTYIYRVEALDQQGQAATAQSVTSQGLDVLPGQLALIFAASVIVYVVWHSGHRWRTPVHSSEKLHLE
jgi:hypothetical protein